MKFNQICVMGLGYIGLPTATLFAKNGIRVLGVDVTQSICDTINKGEIHIEEPFLEELVRDAVKSGMLKASVKPERADAFIICVPTPITKDKKADLSYVVSAARMIAPVLKKGDLVILESTVSPLCTEEVLVPELEKSGLSAKEDIFVAHCPERVLPGQIIRELKENNKIIGGYTEKGALLAKELYSVFVEGELCITDATTAEMCKLMENTYRDVNIALANELAIICEQIGVNAWEVIKYANKHPRVRLHMPGPGVGGHCIAVDPWFVVERAGEAAKIIAMSRRTNDGMPQHVLGRIRHIAPEGKVLLLGCTYKPDVDDTRESPVIALYELLEKSGYEADIYDPHVEKYASGSLYEKAAGASLAVLSVNHSEFRDIDYARLKAAMKEAKLLDTRNALDRGKAKKAGFACYLLGDGRDG